MPQPNAIRRFFALTTSFIDDISVFLRTDCAKIPRQYRRGLISTVLVAACILTAVGAITGNHSLLAVVLTGEFFLNSGGASHISSLLGPGIDLAGAIPQKP